ncbi:MAG: uroporphyrinogen-III C-methyltransferase [Actinomycetota bacterium]|nr:uroporphyrinogen-III C-methyltransferase [Actinomycetota bacterium]
MAKGKVFLIGAGPGDPGLITVKGKEATSAAGVVIYDYLVNPALLKYANEQAELIHVGKSGAFHTLEQDEINNLLVDKARAGWTVARLKGGDPFIFGRGGEEALALAAEGLEFEVIPGVSSAYAAPAYGGIPVTHRGMATSVSFITGHEDPTKEESEIDWQALAHLKGTLVFLMGVKNLGLISKRLTEAGKSGATPAAVIRWGTTASQETVKGTLSDISDKVKAAGLKPPAITVIGQVVNLSDDLAWFTKKPLFGKRVVVTRARSQASALSAKLAALGAEAIEFATIKIVPPTNFEALDLAISSITNSKLPSPDSKPAFDWIVFTSANGVKAFMERLNHLGTDLRDLSGIKIAAIGPATAGELGMHNLKADLIPTEFVAEAVAQALKSEGVSGANILIPRAEEARDVLITELEAAGAKVTVAPVYKTVIDGAGGERARAMLAKGEVDFITFTSSSTVKNFAKSFKGNNTGELLKGVKIASIGPITSSAAKELGLKVDIEAKEYTIDGLVEAICSYEAK